VRPTGSDSSCIGSRGNRRIPTFPVGLWSAVFEFHTLCGVRRPVKLKVFVSFLLLTFPSLFKRLSTITWWFLNLRTEQHFTLFRYDHDIITKYCVQLPMRTLRTSTAISASRYATPTHAPNQYNAYYVYLPTNYSKAWLSYLRLCKAYSVYMYVTSRKCHRERKTEMLKCTTVWF
jgi:AraC-like DNA-binding protein